MEFLWNSVQPQGKLTLRSGCMSQAIRMQPSVYGARKLLICRLEQHGTTGFC